MALPGSRQFALLLAAILVAASPAFAQSTTDQKPADQQKADPGLAAAKRIADELAEIGRTVSGPAGNPECAWIGRRVIRLLSQDDMDTAFRHIELYDRFGCPGAHVQAAFRCLIRQVGQSRRPGADVLAASHHPAGARRCRRARACSCHRGNRRALNALPACVDVR